MPVTARAPRCAVRRSFQPRWRNPSCGPRAARRLFGILWGIQVQARGGAGRPWRDAPSMHQGVTAWPPGRRSPASPHNKPQGGGHAPRSRVNPPSWARVPGGGPHTQPPPGAPTTQRTPAPASPPSSTHLAARDGREPEFGILNSAFAPYAFKSRRRFQAAVLCVRTGNITLPDERGGRLRL